MKKKAEKSDFISSKTKYELLFKLAPVGISIVNSNREVIEYNEALVKVSKLKHNEVIRERYNKRTYINASGQKLQIADLPSSKALHDKKTIRNSEIGIVDESGKVFWTEVSACPVDSDGNYAIVITNDINDKKQLQLKLIESEANYKAIYDNSLDAILLTSPDGKICSANKSATFLFGYSEKELMKLGRNGIVLQNDENLPGLLRKRKAEGKARGEFMFRRKNGSVFIGDVTSSIFKDSNDEQKTVMIIRDITDLRKNQKELMEREFKLEELTGQLRALSNYLEEAREAERSKIALNLHDDLGQKLTVLQLDLLWIKSRLGIQSEVVKLKLDEMSSGIIEIMENIKEISLLLRPSILYDLGLSASIEWHLKKIERISGIRCFFNCNGNISPDEKISLILFRVMQEAINNSVKHSKASEISVSLSRIRKSFRMVIEDNGTGFNPSVIKSPMSLGLIGIKERIGSIGGKLEISSVNEKGTCLTVIIPLNIAK